MMRAFLLALGLLSVVTLPLRAAAPRHAEDAALHAIQMADDKEGWAVGDEGVIWHTIDGGRTWERQPTGVCASLRSVCFQSPYVGWVAGREELPHGNGSAGVLLFTRDGGCTWRRLLADALPGLNRVRFSDAKHGFLLGDGSDQLPTGVFRTEDGGSTWKPVPGPHCPSWLDGDFQDGQSGALTGAWGRLATLRQGGFSTASVDTLGGRSLCSIRLLANDRALAVGQGGLILTSRSRGSAWGYADLKLPPEVLAGWDFHALEAVGSQVWVAGRPGSAILHSNDAGLTWKTFKTEQPLPLNGLFFLDERRGWAVGELGSILHTEDGGATWQVQKGGGQRAAVLFVQARATGLPAETVARLGEQDGYLAAGVCVAGPDPKSAPPREAAAEARFAACLRLAGGAAGEVLWQFPLPQHLAGTDKQGVLRAWDQLHGDRAAEQLLRQLVLAIRTWRPDVIVTDAPEGSPAGALVAEAARAAFNQAADPQAFPEQLSHLGLGAWRAGKVYALGESAEGAQVHEDGNELCPRIRETPREFAAAAAALLTAVPPVLPGQRHYRLLDSKVEGALAMGHLMDGLPPGAEGVARRALPEGAEPKAAELKALRARKNLQVLAEVQPGPLTNPGKVLGQVGPVLDALPEDRGAATAFALASQYARAGQWPLAQEVFLLMTERYPAQPLTADAYRWLIRHNSSSEVRRRYELSQFKRSTQATVSQPNIPTGGIVPAEEMVPQPGSFAVRGKVVPRDGAAGQETAGNPKATSLRPRKTEAISDGTKEVAETSVTFLANPVEVRQWCKGSLEMARRLEGLGPLFGSDPAIQLCLLAARRQLGQFKEAADWCRRFQLGNASPAWRSAAAAELWLLDHQGPPPRPLMLCRLSPNRPLLDGSFDDPCWEGLTPVVLQNAVGDTVKDYHTEARLAFDEEFLYIAVRCTHPAGCRVPPAKVRQRDADLHAFDRVSILLDLDRDYSTCFHLQVDQRGCVREDCWGDVSWNPRWYVAVRSNEKCWQVEAAIPLVELTGQKVALNTAWACNVVRVLPGRGVQAWSLPADVEPRPEGMGLLLFQEGLRASGAASARR
jgi:photosystem II stability/assembly factor-like uncharacterized protein